MNKALFNDKLIYAMFLCSGLSILSLNRFLNCLMILEKFKVLVLLFSLMVSYLGSHVFFVLMVVSTVDVIIGLVVLTRMWE